MYYLGSRYYDPQVKRFINADSANLITANTYGLTDKNLFSYCDNNPVNRSDDGGKLWNIVVGAVIGGTLGALTTAITGGDTDDIIHSAISGAISGGVAASGIGIVGQRLIGAATSAADTLYGGIRKIKSGESSVGQVAVKTIVSAGIGALTAGSGMNNKKMQSMRSAAQVGRRTLRSVGNHPRIKRAATTAVNAFKNYARKQYVTLAKETAVYSSFSWGVSKAIDVAYSMAY